MIIAQECNKRLKKNVKSPPNSCILCQNPQFLIPTNRYNIYSVVQYKLFKKNFYFVKDFLYSLELAQGIIQERFLIFLIFNVIKVF